MEYARDIVIAMIQNDFLPRYQDNDKTIEAVKKAFDEVYKQILKSSREGH